MKKVNKITFIGIGLINSSLARDLKGKGFYKTSSAFSRTKKTRNKLRKLNIVDIVEESYESAVSDADIVIVGVPVAAFTSVIKNNSLSQRRCNHNRCRFSKKIINNNSKKFFT